MSPRACLPCRSLRIPCLGPVSFALVYDDDHGRFRRAEFAVHFAEVRVDASGGLWALLWSRPGPEVGDPPAASYAPLPGELFRSSREGRSDGASLFVKVSAAEALELARMLAADRRRPAVVTYDPTSAAALARLFREGDGERLGFGLPRGWGLPVPWR